MDTQDDKSQMTNCRSDVCSNETEVLPLQSIRECVHNFLLFIIAMAFIGARSIFRSMNAINGWGKLLLRKFS
jgi:hypothetical protein